MLHEFIDFQLNQDILTKSDIGVFLLDQAPGFLTKFGKKFWSKSSLNLFNLLSLFFQLSPVLSVFFLINSQRVTLGGDGLWCGPFLEGLINKMR